MLPHTNLCIHAVDLTRWAKLQRKTLSGYMLSWIWLNLTWHMLNNACCSSFTNTCETVSMRGRLWQWYKQSNQCLSIFVQVDKRSKFGPLVILAPFFALQLHCTLLLKALKVAFSIVWVYMHMESISVCIFFQHYDQIQSQTRSTL